MLIPKDMPKLEAPFVRKEIGGHYVVTPEINPGYEWVFEDPQVQAIEKLDGTNVSIVVENGQVTQIYNRTERVPFFNKGKRYISDGLLYSFDKGYISNLPDGQWFGELIGPKVNGNRYKLNEHQWIPFATYAAEKLAYRSFHNYAKNYGNFSEWFQSGLFSLFGASRGFKEAECEGIVFTHPDGRMAKLRRDMFPWYKGKRH